ncbi:Gfo/Idh/MocA family protein [Glycomyces harbinensis]|uniref:Oxidoreductase family, C-terminal alpha/beta domain n=1 Tax=Glycomyces harbinensis TaxID=58114 RepID=A0A1G7D4Y4_9ACTN|nr:Gfo/Idh/MocA family oxidoreductase [Glycomyces harbinensis]SDE46648.1 Oxidoreductase family, C-terminal alpha/beta domain [Glycomyces harbinensis]
MVIRLGILGAGARGSDTYGRWAIERPDRAAVAAVADPMAHRGDRLADAAGVPADRRYPDWRDLVADADAIGLDAFVIALPDRLHLDAALAAVGTGLPILLEKPAATTPEALEALAAAARETKARIWVSHVMRYQPFWRTIRSIVDSGVIGRLVTIRAEENIGFWHYAHSYVRGNWRNLASSSPMVLAKTCHDLDVIRWFAGEAPASVASAGSLRYFRPEHAPEGAPDHCLDGCPAADSCPFYAPRYYVEALADTDGWPVALLGDDLTPEGRTEALRHGPYGRCVFHSDNDVVDHQQTVVAFPGGLTATLSTSAFTGQNTRTVRLTGTAGEIAGNLRTGVLEVDLFSPTAVLPVPPEAQVRRRFERPPMGHQVVELYSGPVDASGEPDHRGHSGGDEALVDAFITALSSPDEHGASTSLEASLDSHRMAFAAERSRLEGRTIDWEAP